MSISRNKNKLCSIDTIEYYTIVYNNELGATNVNMGISQ